MNDLDAIARKLWEQSRTLYSRHSVKLPSQMSPRELLGWRGLVNDIQYTATQAAALATEQALAREMERGAR